MSNFLAIATVTATLRRIMQDTLITAASEEPGGVSGAYAYSQRPDGNGTGSTIDKGVNIYLYQVTPNAAYRNADLPIRRPDGTLVNRPQAALDLDYLFSFYGEETYLEPQRVMGVVVRTLHSRPILTRAMIRDTLADPLFNFLTASNLADQIELVKLAPLNLSLEELSKLWSVFFQTPYALSVAYQATVVLIESEETFQEALPVRQPNVYAVPYRQPVVERVADSTGDDQPIVADSTLNIWGRKLHGEVTQIRIASQYVTPPDPILDTKIQLPLSSVPAGKLAAGVQGLQVIHRVLMGTPPVEHRGFESNVAPFILHPKIQQDSVSGAYLVSKSSVTGSGDGPYAGNITLQVTPAIGRTQRVALLLNQIAPPADEPAAYSFAAPDRAPSAPATDESITIPFSGVDKATYLVRVQVDGAESPLETVGGTYAEPKIDIP
jgi:hypothetical protein